MVPSFLFHEEDGSGMGDPDFRNRKNSSSYFLKQDGKENLRDWKGICFFVNSTEIDKVISP